MCWVYAVVSMANYSIKVSHLPYGVTAQDLRRHFHNLLFSESKYNKPARRSEENEIAPTTHVASVCITFDCEAHIAACAKRGEVLRARQQLAHVSNTCYDYRLADGRVAQRTV